MVDSSASIRPIPRASRQLDAGQPRDGLAFGQCNEPACAVPCVREKRRQTGGKDFFPLLSALGPFLGDQANWPPLSEPLLFFCELSQLVCEHCRPFLEVRRRRGLAGWRLRTRMRSVVLGRWRLQGKGGVCVGNAAAAVFYFFCPQRRDVLPSSNWTFVESGLVRVGFRTRGTAPLFLCSAARSELYRYFFYFLSNAYRSVGKKIECRSPTAGLRRMCGGGGNQGVCSGQLPLKEDKRRVNEGPGVSAPVLENVGSGALPCAVRGCTVALTWAGPIRRVENGCGPKPQRK